MNILKAIEWWTLNGQIIWHVNYSSTKLLKKKKGRVLRIFPWQSWAEDTESRSRSAIHCRTLAGLSVAFWGSPVYYPWHEGATYSDLSSFNILRCQIFIYLHPPPENIKAHLCGRENEEVFEQKAWTDNFQLPCSLFVCFNLTEV